MNIYHYHRNTHEYLGSTEARIDPLETVMQEREVYLIPANATVTPPPEVTTNQVAVWENEAWVVKEDHRGKTCYEKATAAPIVITEIGVIPDTLTELVPAVCSEWDGDQWGVDGTALKSKVLADKLSELAAYRYDKETGGITVSGMTIKTDRESQNMIAGAKLYSDLNESILIDWKATNGWVQIDRATILTISQAVASHVQACFSNEKVHDSAIALLSTIAEIEAYNITTGWPT
jgi:hypothetical protein